MAKFFALIDASEILIFFSGLWVGVVGGSLAHECGHALCGRLAGYRIREIQIGSGKEIFQRRFGDVVLRIAFSLRTWGSGGRVQTFPSLTVTRAGRLLYIAGGPAANLLVFGLASQFVDRLETMLFAIPIANLQIWLFVKSVFFPTAVLDGRRMRSDGGQMLDTIKSKSAPSKPLAEFYLAQLHAKWDGVGAAPHVSPRSDKILYQVYGRQDLQSSTLNAAAISDCEELLAAPLHPAEEILLLDRLATSALYDGDPLLTAKLDAWTHRALTLNPHLATLKGSRAAALVQLGRYGEARAMLREADYTTAHDTMLNKLFESVAAFRQGDRDEAHRLFGEAADAHRLGGEQKARGPWALLQRVAGEIGCAQQEAS